ncbi:MAG: TonB-dependent receptor plug domain-containing protein [Porphyromonas sp.]|nr:TonB-dependent receptor plug domain-containing protein [Porphyromonas sp.]
MKLRCLFQAVLGRFFSSLCLSLLLLSLSIPATLVAQDKNCKQRISGYVYEKGSREIVIRARIKEPVLKTGTLTNSYGFFSLELPCSSKEIEVYSAGSQPQTIRLTGKDTLINVFLSPVELDEVVVVGRKNDSELTSSRMGSIEIPLEIIRRAPALLGEADPLKTIQMLPGVQAGVDGSAGIFVRGGGQDENLFLLDGVPLYNVNHLFGFFSVFTPEAIKRVDLYKGSFPSRFGGRLSSVVDIRTNDGNMRSYHGTASIGLISSKFHFEGPIIKDKTSIHASYRRTYADILARPFMTETEKGGYYFQDFTLKLNHRFGDRDRLFLSLYGGDDSFYSIFSETQNKIQIKTEGKISWGNLVSSLRWNHIFSSQLFSNTTVAYTRYKLNTSNKESEYVITDGRPKLHDGYDLRFTSGIEDVSARMDMEYYPVHNHTIKFGGAYVYHTFRPEALSFKPTKINEQEEQELLKVLNQSPTPIRAHDISLYAEDEMRLLPWLDANIGMHYSIFGVNKKLYHSIEPRASLRIAPTDIFDIKLSYTKMSQNIHLLSSFGLSMPTDLWVPATDRISPMSADQFALGAYSDVLEGWRLSAEGYYKTIKNTIEYKDGAMFMGFSSGWQEKVEQGEGRSYGVEVMAQKTEGKLSGWLSYTYAKSERRFGPNGINQGVWFPVQFDRRHNVNIVATYALSKALDVTATWEYRSGGRATVGIGMTEYITNQSGGYSGNYFSNHWDPHGNRLTPTPLVTSRNNYQMPSTHLLNLSLNYHVKHKRGSSIWNFSVYNVYNRRNPTFLVLQTNRGGIEPQKDAVPMLKRISILPILPSISYTYKF